MKIDSSGDEKVGQINGFKLLLSAWLQSTIRIVNYYPDIRIIRISVSALIHSYLLENFIIAEALHTKYLGVTINLKLYYGMNTYKESLARQTKLMAFCVVIYANVLSHCYKLMA